MSKTKYEVIDDMNKQKEQIAAKAIKFCNRIAKIEKGCAPSAGYMQELIEAAEDAIK